MRKVTKTIKEAYDAGRKKTVGNTWTDGENIWLHANLIIARHDGVSYFSLAGWPTKTTLDRINGILGLDLSIKGGEVFMADKPRTGVIMVHSDLWYRASDYQPFATIEDIRGPHLHLEPEPKFKEGDKVIWWDEIWEVFEFQPHNGPNGSYHLKNARGHNGCAGEKELKSYDWVSVNFPDKETEPDGLFTVRCTDRVGLTDCVKLQEGVEYIAKQHGPSTGETWLLEVYDAEGKGRKLFSSRFEPVKYIGKEELV